MTMDKSLKSSEGLAGARSVLTRAERITKMMEEGKFEADKNSALGLPKFKVRHSKAGSKAKKTEEEGAEGAPAAGAEAKAAPAGGKAPAGKAAAGGKAAPAAAAKPAAKPAAKGDAKKK